MPVVQTLPEWEQSEGLSTALAGLAQHEKELRFKRFDNHVAFLVGDAIRQSLTPEQSALISIRTWDGATLFQLAHGPSVSVNNEEWVRRKTNTVREYKKASFLVGRELVGKGREINSLGADYAAHGGAFPIRIQGAYDDPIGAIIVSGLKQWQDHDLVVRAIQEVNGRM